MTLHARYRTLDNGAIGEETTQLTPDSGADLISILTTKAPFGMVITHTTGSGKTASIISQLTAGIRGDCAALHYTDENGAWYTEGPTPDNDGPVYADIDFPDHTEIPATQLPTAIDHYCRKASRPTTVAWKPDPYQP